MLHNKTNRRHGLEYMICRLPSSTNGGLTNTHFVFTFLCCGVSGRHWQSAKHTCNSVQPLDRGANSIMSENASCVTCTERAH